MTATPLLRKTFTVQEFRQILELDFLQDTRLELLNGEIIDMGKIGPRHAAIVRRLTRLLSQQLDPTQATLDVQNPIEISPNSQPQPDLSLLVSREDDYEARHPLPSDVVLLIEVADTTLESDRKIKVPLYSQAGIPEVWLVDLNGKMLTAHRQPSPQGYRLVQLQSFDDTISPLRLPDVSLSLRSLFPQ
ncbi:MAG: Uma2 family endonuclease [Spirulina sp. SIO3F2]|nr:Uma2 family endonuclease [Spirulina sp. SIO3F2]